MVDIISTVAQIMIEHTVVQLVNGDALCGFLSFLMKYDLVPLR